MTQDHSTAPIAPTLHPTDPLDATIAKLQELHLPFAQNFARALVALLAAKKISLHEVANLMPGEQSLDANRQQLMQTDNS